MTARREPAQAPRCEERDLPSRSFKVKASRASSVLKEKGLPDDQYSPDNATDGREDTAWVEGASGPGVGEWLELTFIAPLPLPKPRC
ncbi:MAG: hypothetical protein A2V77_11265 [Anaeromyxobacter sp. RBG_16_69_14]|nr:MAG: hypothetical protein A2V77_11265 [Anaeromyxobacter sp. RBG_16_69_14]